MNPRAMILMPVVLACISCMPANGSGSATTGQAASPAAAQQEAPAIASIEPEAVSLTSGAITEIVISGVGFEPGTPGRNTVEVGRIVLNMVPANADGTQIRFVIPQEYSSGGGTPPRRTAPGDYTVRVRTSMGVSNGMTVRVQ